MRLKLQQKLVVAEKKTNAIYFVTIASLREGILEMQIKGTMNVKCLRQTSMQVYDINRFCRYYTIYDFYRYFEEHFARKEIVNKVNHAVMDITSFEQMMNADSGYVMLRVQGDKKKGVSAEEYLINRANYLSLMHLALELNEKKLFEQWGKQYEQVERDWKNQGA